jgi:hypothetical protein
VIVVLTVLLNLFFWFVRRQGAVNQSPWPC